MRAPTLDQSLRKLGVEKLSKEDVAKMPWESLEGKITNWIHYMRIAVRRTFYLSADDDFRFHFILKMELIHNKYCLIVLLTFKILIFELCVQF